MIHVKEIKKIGKLEEEYPNNIKLIENFTNLQFNSDVTILVGDNGSGKTTFMNIFANLLKVNRINFPNQNPSAKDIKLAKASKAFKVNYSMIQVGGFFFQGEEFINYLNYLNATLASCYEEIKRVENEYRDKSAFALKQAKAPYLETIQSIKSLYSYSLLERSHGEGFMDFFKSRLKHKQIYLLDEPETPLSFTNLLLMIALIKEAVQNNCQFIISTHSPVLMAYPNASIYVIENDKFLLKEFDELDSVIDLKNFLNNKEAYLRHL